MDSDIKELNLVYQAIREVAFRSDDLDQPYSTRAGIFGKSEDRIVLGSLNPLPSLLHATSVSHESTES